MIHHNDFGLCFYVGKHISARTKQISMVDFLIYVTFDRSDGFRSKLIEFIVVRYPAWKYNNVFCMSVCFMNVLPM